MAMNVDVVSEVRPRWPASPIDPAGVDLDYDPPADELTLFFGGKPVPSYCDPFHVDGYEDVAIMVDLGPDDSSSGEIVGIQVIPLLVGAVQKHPEWAILAWGSLTGFTWEEEMLRAAIADFIAEVADLFERYWTPPPPIEEQVAHLARSGQQDEPGGEGAR